MNNHQQNARPATGGSKSANLQLEIERYLNNKYHFRYNEVNGKLEYKIQADKNYQAISDYQLNTLVREMVHAGIKCNVSLLRNTLLSNFTPVFNPFTEYFDGLPAWDGITDHIQELANTVNTTNDTLWHTCLKKWLVAMVGCAISDTVVNHTVIVFAGKQGLGKTSWILKLVPHCLKEYCFSGTINPGNKDTLIQLAENMFINMDELENLNKADLGMLKEIITKASIKMRRPYGISNETLPRRASFMGSVNGHEFLNDTTGNRRFLCFEATKIDYGHSVQLDLVYAQALHLFRTGFKYWFDNAENDAINLSNSQFRNLSVEEELLTSYFTPCNVDEADYLFTTTELLTWLGQKAKVSLTDAAKQKMGKALKANGYVRVKRQNRYVYGLKEPIHVPELPAQILSTKNLTSSLFG